MGDAGLPNDVLFVMLIVVPIGLALFFGWFAFDRLKPLVFRCLHCGAEFHRKPTRRFPARCPACGARDWNTSDDGDA